MYNKCCIVGCESKRKDIRLFKIPKHTGLLWVKCLKLKHLSGLSSQQLDKFCVCAKHFEKKFFIGSSVKPRLCQSAIPTIFTESAIKTGIPDIVIVSENKHYQAEHNYTRKQHLDHTYCRDNRKGSKSSENNEPGKDASSSQKDSATINTEIATDKTTCAGIDLSKDVPPTRTLHTSTTSISRLSDNPEDPLALDQTSLIEEGVAPTINLGDGILYFPELEFLDETLDDEEVELETETEPQPMDTIQNNSPIPEEYLEDMDDLASVNMEENDDQQFLLKDFLCATCFTFGRQLKPLTENDNFGLIQQMCVESEIPYTDEDKICWECEAMLNNIRKFKLKALAAQILFKDITEEDDQITSKSLSNLQKSEMSHLSISIEGDLNKQNDEPEEKQANEATKQTNDMENDMDFPYSLPDLQDDDFDFPESIPDTQQNDMDLPDIPGLDTDEKAFGIAAPFLKGPLHDHRYAVVSEDDDGVNVNKKKDETTPTKTSEPTFEKPKRLYYGPRPKYMYNVKHVSVIKDKLNLSTQPQQVKVVCKQIHLTREELDIFREKKRNKWFMRSQYKCDTCIVKFKGVKQMERHYKKHDVSAGTYVCKICEVRFLLSASRDEHYKSHFTVYECAVCGLQKEKRFLMLAHFEKMHYEQRRVCRDCGQVFKVFQEFQRHRLSEHGPKLTCKHCGKIFREKHNFAMHMRRHNSGLQVSQLADLKCRVCDVPIRGPKLLYKHMLDAHQIKEEERYCSLCNLQFKTWSSFYYHLMSLKHARKAKLPVEKFMRQCEDCGRFFTNQTLLNIHRKHYHVYEKSYCELCNKEFISKALLSLHQRTSKRHKTNRVRDKVCEICGKSFFEKRALNTHLYTHNLERPYVCDVCGRAFTGPQGLSKHRKKVHRITNWHKHYKYSVFPFEGFSSEV